MTTDWRNLLDSLRIPWVDRGRNTPRDSISIECCWCGDDPSQHLAISEVKPAYYCFRNPQDHSGTNIPRLVMKLARVNREDAIALLNNFNTLVAATPHERIKREPGTVAKMWETFLPAEHSQEMLDYMYDRRGFSDPIAVCERYGLRYSQGGKWARRLLFPIVENDEVISWTGRATIDRLTPKYSMLAVEHEGLIYNPRSAEAHQLIVEGPMDALKIAVATEHLPISSTALIGLNLGASRKERIRAALIACRRIYIALDSTVTTDKPSLGIAPHYGPGKLVYTIKAELASLNRSWYIDRLAPPDGFDDAAEMNEQEIVRWITRAL